MSRPHDSVSWIVYMTRAPLAPRNSFIVPTVLAVEEKPDHSAALLCLAARATMRAAKDGGSWWNAKLLLPVSDPYGQEEELDDFELVAIAQHNKPQVLFWVRLNNRNQLIPVNDRLIPRPNHLITGF